MNREQVELVAALRGIDSNVFTASHIRLACLQAANMIEALALAGLEQNRNAKRYEWLRESARTGESGKPWIAISSMGGISAWQGEQADRMVDTAMETEALDQAIERE